MQERQRMEREISDLQGRNEQLLATVESLQHQKPIKVSQPLVFLTYVNCLR